MRLGGLNMSTTCPKIGERLPSPHLYFKLNVIKINKLAKIIFDIAIFKMCNLAGSVLDTSSDTTLYHTLREKGKWQNAYLTNI